MMPSKQFFNRKTKKWHIMQHFPGEIPEWRVTGTGSVKFENVPVVKKQKPEQPGQEQPTEPEQPEGKSHADTKSEESSDTQQSKKDDISFFDWF